MYKTKNEKLLDTVKKFFGFGDDPRDIMIVIPQVPRIRPGLSCKNYPRFNFEVSPDDVYSVLRVFQWLTILYEDKVKANLSVDLISLPKEFNRVLIGGPATNKFSYSSLEDQVISFHNNYEIRSKKGKEKKYCIKYDDDTKDIKDRFIVEDYCLITKKSLHQEQYVEFVIAGIRAYGQLGAYTFLKDDKFFESIQDLLEYKNFQILVKISVNNGTIVKWEIVEKEHRLSKNIRIFMSYNTADLEDFHILEIATLLQSRPEIIQVFCWEFREDSNTTNTIDFMEQGINTSDIFLAFCTKRSIKNENCKKERDMAILKNKKIIPLYDDINNVPGLIQSNMGVDLIGKDTEEVVEKILSFIQKKIFEEKIMET